jgi:hypothetical protein
MSLFIDMYIKVGEYKNEGKREGSYPKGRTLA